MHTGCWCFTLNDDSDKIHRLTPDVSNISCFGLDPQMVHLVHLLQCRLLSCRFVIFFVISFGS